MARYEALKEPMIARKQKLADSLRLQQLFRDVEDEETWIREKEPIAASTNRGKDLIGVQNLLKKHQALQAEIAGHEPRIRAVTQKGTAMVEEGESGLPERLCSVLVVSARSVHGLESAWTVKAVSILF